MSTCSHCGGAIFPLGAVIGYAGLLCTCHRPGTYGPIPPTPPEPRRLGPLIPIEKLLRPNAPVPTQSTPYQGWQCPLCKTVHAPFVKACDRDHK